MERNGSIGELTILIVARGFSNGPLPIGVHSPRSPATGGSRERKAFNCAGLDSDNQRSEMEILWRAYGPRDWACDILHARNIDSRLNPFSVEDQMTPDELSLQRNGWVKQSDGSWSKQPKGNCAEWLAEAMATRVSNSFPKRPTSLPLEKSARNEERRGKRLLLRITRHACRVLDFDNGAGGCKALVDQLRYAGLIPDDNPEAIDFRFAQVKVKMRKEQGTLIEIEEIA